MLRKVFDKFVTRMIPLRASLFLIYGASATMMPFLQVYIKQKGLDIGDIAFFYLLSSGLQVLTIVGSGIIIDKVGHPKFVVLGSLILAALMLNGMVFVPNMTTTENDKVNISFTTQVSCHTQANISSSSLILSSTEIEKCIICCHHNKSAIFNKSADCYYGFNTIEAQKAIISYDINTKGIFILFNSDDNESENCTKRQVMIQKHLYCNYNSCVCSDDDLCSLTSFSDHTDKVPSKALPKRNEFLYFSLLLICFLGYGTMFTCALRTMDIIIMMLVKTHNLDFGREKFLPMVSVILFSVLSGYMVENLTKPGQPPYYEIAIYLFDALAILAITIICTIKITFEKPETHLFKTSISFLMNIDTITFFIIVLIIGTCMNFQKQFSALYLDSLAASSLLLALTPAIEHMYGLPFLIFSNVFVRSGKEKLFFILALIGYVINFIGYVYLENPWWSLMLEATGILTHHLLWVAVIRHSYIVAPKGLTSTVVAISGALHFAIGSGTSSLLGGLVMNKYGGRIAYKIMSILAGGSGLLYAFYLCIVFLYAKCYQKNSEDPITENQRLIKSEKDVCNNK